MSSLIRFSVDQVVRVPGTPLGWRIQTLGCIRFAASSVSLGVLNQRRAPFMDTPLHIVSITSFAALLVACASSPYPVTPAVPPSLQAPAGSTLYLEALRPECRSTSARASPIQLTSGPSRRPRQRSRRGPDSRLASITRGPPGRRSMAAPRSVRPRHESLPRHPPRFLGCSLPQSPTPAAVLLPTPSCPARRHGRRYRADRSLQRVNDQEVARVPYSASYLFYR